MRIIRVLRVGAASLALSLPVLALGGGCDGGANSGQTSIKESPEEAATRQKKIEDAYKSNPTDASKKAGAAKK